MGDWSMFELAVVRAAGFGVELVAGVARPELYAQVKDWTATRAQLAGAATAFLAAAAGEPRPEDRAAYRAAGACLRRVNRRQPLEADAPVPALVPGYPGGPAFIGWWNGRCRRAGELAAAIEHEYTRTLGQARAHLDETLRDDRVRAALTLLTPEILGTTVRSLLARPAGGPAPNQQERKAVAYLQRLATKCETNGVAGPIGYALLGPSRIGLPPESGHQGFVAHWAAAELTRAWLARAARLTGPLRAGSMAAHLPPTSAPDRTQRGQGGPTR